MANDLFGGLGGLMKGLSGFMPQDDPNVKLMNAQNEVSSLKQQETEIYAEIGKIAVAEGGTERFGSLSDRLRLVQSNLAVAEGSLNALATDKEKNEQAKKEAAEQSTCPSCGHLNPDGTKFCQECGEKLGYKARCSCGQENPPGTRFCGGCGAKLL